jgi:hypothetical protein
MENAWYTLIDQKDSFNCLPDSISGCSSADSYNTQPMALNKFPIKSIYWCKSHI